MREINLKDQARSIFAKALLALDAGAAVRKAVKLSGNFRLTIVDEGYKLTGNNAPVYAVAVGKAACPMAFALDEILGSKLTAGVVSGVLPEEFSTENPAQKGSTLSSKWRVFAGGHPLPNEESLAAAQSCFYLLRKANRREAIVVFLISGGGSAMLESPFDDLVTLEDLREANRALVSCGASIAEINVIRRAFSRVKGGGLATFAPLAAQISLIVSDTEIGDEASVASGPTFESGIIDFDEVISIIKHYELSAKLTESILNSVLQKRLEKTGHSPKNLCRHYVLLDNQSAINAAAAAAKSSGFVVETARGISQQFVSDGCAELMRQMTALCGLASENDIACLISGGEFSCPVRGAGIGGRNSETALRMALMLSENRNGAESKVPQIAFLSAGTDGIDGNSPAAGAVCDDTMILQARTAGLDARLFLDNSDAYSFFHALGDTIMTRPTGTNVRDLRIMIARK